MSGILSILELFAGFASEVLKHCDHVTPRQHGAHATATGLEGLFDEGGVVPVRQRVGDGGTPVGVVFEQYPGYAGLRHVWVHFNAENVGGRSRTPSSLLLSRIYSTPG